MVASLKVGAWRRYLVHMVQLDAAAMNLKRRFEDPNIAASLEAQQAYTRALAPGGDSPYLYPQDAALCCLASSPAAIVAALQFAHWRMCSDRGSALEQLSELSAAAGEQVCSGAATSQETLPSQKPFRLCYLQDVYFT